MSEQEHTASQAQRAFVDAADTHEEPQPQDEAAATAPQASALEPLEGVVNLAADAAYAAAGIADLIGEKAKTFYQEQARQYSQAHPDVEASTSQAFLGQLGDQLNKLVDELSQSFKGLADRGRDALQRASEATSKDDDSDTV